MLFTAICYRTQIISSLRWKQNYPLKHIIEGNIRGTGGRGIRRKQLLNNLKSKEDAWNWKRQHYIALCGEFALEEAMGLSWDRLRNELFSCSHTLNVQIIQHEILNLKNLIVRNNFSLSYGICYYWYTIKLHCDAFSYYYYYYYY